MKPKPLSHTNTIKLLRYIAKSPDRKHGGVHANTILAAKTALGYLRRP